MENLLVKGKFICFEKEFYGLFLLYLDLKTKAEKAQIAAGGSSFISTYSIETSGDKLLYIIEELLEDEEASLSKSREIKSLLLSQGVALNESLKDIGSLEKLLKAILQNYLKAPVELSLSSEKVENFDLREVDQERIEKDQKAQAEEERIKYKIPSGAEVIDCFAVLSPIKGKPIQEIREGDLILSKIDDTTEKGAKIAENFHLYTENKRIKPVIGKVYQKFHEDKEIVLIINLGKNLAGFAREDETVKITYIEPDKIVSKVEQKKQVSQKIKKEEKKSAVKKEQIKSEMFVYILVGLLVVVLSFALFFFS